jgi:hypothetical protein
LRRGHETKMCKLKQVVMNGALGHVLGIAVGEVVI